MIIVINIMIVQYYAYCLDFPNESSSLLAHEEYKKNVALPPGIDGGQCTNCQKRQDVQIHIETVQGSVEISHHHHYPPQDTDPTFLKGHRPFMAQKSLKSSKP